MTIIDYFHIFEQGYDQELFKQWMIQSLISQFRDFWQN